MADRSVTPIAVRAPFKGNTTEIDWADGHRGVYPNDVLRGYCPCAGCQGHSGDLRFIEGGDPEIRELAPVGDYALQLTWGDGHDTGIYTFRLLRELCQCPKCVPPEHAAERPTRARS
jgi:DUF971 family protein